MKYRQCCGDVEKTKSTANPFVDVFGVVAMVGVDGVDVDGAGTVGAVAGT